jgi:hypothetical protein
MKSDPASVPLFTAPYAPDDGAIAARLLATANLGAEQDLRIDGTATRLIDAIRASDDRLGGVEDMLREFALSTKEGLALMVRRRCCAYPTREPPTGSSRTSSAKATSCTTRPNPARSWSMRRHGRWGCRRA